ncbi:hypothetical protein AAG906_020416 [Vitis piasezkii]
MTSSSTQRASSSTCIRNSYHVFLSFRGEDTRKNFTDHLYTTLVAYGLQVFRDDELEKGGDIASDLSRAIEESKILLLFSQKLCQLQMVSKRTCEDHRANGRKKSRVLPVFYHVNPSNVRKQSGSYEEAFPNHEADANQEKERIQNCRSALMKAADLSGSHVDDQ